MNDLTFKTTRMIGTISVNDRSGWRKTLRVGRWIGKEEKYDLREWAPDDSRCGKGLVLSSEEARKLYALLKAQFGGAHGE